MVDQHKGGAVRCEGEDSRDHLSMAVLQSTLEVTVRANLGTPFDDLLVDGFFLGFFGHPS